MNKENVLRWIIYVGAGLLAFTPLIVANLMYFPFITGKAFFFRVIVMIIFAAWVILALYDKSARPRFSWVAAALGLWLVVALVASVLGVNPGDSIWSNFERMMGWITVLHVVMAFFALAHTFKLKHWRYLFYLSFGVSVIAAMYGFGEVGDENRVDGTLGNPIYLAAYSLFHGLLAGYFILRRIKERVAKELAVWADWRLYVFAGLAIINFLALYYTKTRGAILGLLAGLGVALLLVAIFERARPWVRRVAIGGVIAGLVLVGGFFAFQDSEFVQNQPVLERFASISLEEGNAGARLDTWGIALEGYTQSAKTALIGWGPGNFNYVFNNYYDPAMFDDATWFDRAHNVVIEWLVAAGPLGALSYLGLFTAAIYLIWKKDEGERIKEGEEFSVLEKSLLTGLVVAYLVQNLTVFDHLVSYLVFLMLLGWLHTRRIPTPQTGWLAWVRGWFRRDDELSEATKAWASTGVALAAVALLILWNWPGYAQANTLVDALRDSSAAEQLQRNGQTRQATQAYQSALDTYKDAIAHQAMGTQEARERLLQATTDVAGSDAPNSIKQAYFTEADREMKQMIAEEPGDVRHYVFHGQLLLSFGQTERAITQLERASEMSGNKKQVILFQLARAYEAAGEPEKALAAYKQAYELSTSFDEPAIRYAAYAIQEDQAGIAEEVLMKTFGTTTVVSPTLIEAYNQNENYEAILPILKKRLANNSNNVQSYVSVAAAYEKLGRDEEAIDILEEAISKFPAMEEQINEIIQQIRAGNPIRP